MTFILTALSLNLASTDRSTETFLRPLVFKEELEANTQILHSSVSRSGGPFLCLPAEALEVVAWPELLGLVRNKEQG